MSDDNGEFIDEAPMGVREFEQVLAGHLSRGDRRRLWKALKAANLIIFHGDDER